ncbi:MAG: Gfo/Idh/MocA family oxidoreductase [Candidatus Hydrogenedens sp.]|nr:Gfo/Idh/MocA family oxidoreductase [Candidatus Hydrogenedentota bacterium]NLF59264.1 Gfo/Idh/MocA family oxidoreductase [Candidatus Hydrogenedens sp.]
MAKVGFGIIGCGNIGPVHAAAIAAVSQAKLVAVSDIVEATAQKLGGQYGAEVHTDYRKMLERKDIQAVCLCVPSGLRVEIAEACAAAGKNILSEKPLEVSTKRIDRIIAATDKAGVRLGCIFQSRFAEGSLLVKKAIEQGRFGKLVLGDAYIKWYRSPEYYASGAWRGTKKLDGGGALMNQGIHQIDLLQWFMGPVAAVTAKTTRALHAGLEVEDLATAMLEFKSGAFGVIEGSTAVWPGHPARVEVHGTEGSVYTEDGAIKFWQFKKRLASDAKIEAGLSRESELGTGAGDPLSGLKTEGHRRQIMDFAQAIQKGRAPLIDGREGRNAVALIEAIYKSAATGKTVKL